MDKKKIIKYAGISILSTTILVGGALAISDVNFDHTEGVCIIASINNNIGRKHQMSEMWDEYMEKGIDIDGISYKNEEFIPVKDNELLEDISVKMR